MSSGEINVRYHDLIRKLDRFIRKYYRNQLIRGLILFAAISLISFLAVISLEYLGHFDTVTRTLLFYLYLAANLAVFIRYIAFPLLKMQKIGRTITYEQAAEIIGRHFTGVGDKLLNTLQLNRILESGNNETDLLEASIIQKTKQLNPVPFASAINLKKNRKFLKYALFPLIVLLLLVFIFPSFISRPTGRILHHTRVFEEEMPVRFVLVNEKLEAFQQEDFTTRVRVEGEFVPDEVFIEVEGIPYKMIKENTQEFSYTLKTLQRSLKFRFTGGKYRSAEYELKVVPRPLILNFEVELNFPAYLNRKKEVLENTGDLIVPEGTRATWRFFTRDVSEMWIRLPDQNLQVREKEGNRFSFDYLLATGISYTIQAFNSYSRKPDSLTFSATVIRDAYPLITAEESTDTTLPARRFFRGIIRDDYGFSRLIFALTVMENGDTSRKNTSTTAIPINVAVNQQTFYYSVDLSGIVKNPGDIAEYYFEVCDNDAIHGNKCSRTGIFRYRAPTEEEIAKLTEQAQQDITRDLESALKEAQSVQRQMDEISRKLVEKNSLNWQDQQQIRDLLDREKEIRDKLDKIQRQSEQRSNLEEQYNQIDSSIMEKQRKLNELFNEIMDDEMKKLVQDLRDMLDKIDKNQVQQMLEKMKMSNRDIEKQLDRSLELFKQLEFEKNLAKTIEDLKKLADQQENLSEEKEDKEKDQLLMEQKGIRDEFNEIKKQLKDLEKQNSALEQPNNFPNTEKEQEAVSDDLNNSLNSLENNNRKEAGRSQKNASGKMKKLASRLEETQQDMEGEQLAEDIGMLRQVLENLIRISFEQEDLMNRTKLVNRNDPRYLALIQQQNDLREDLDVVADSLQQLAKRQVMIKPYILRELSSIDENAKGAVDFMNSRNIAGAAARQQYVMTAVNNLALLLSEVLKEMESQMNMMCGKPGNSACNKGSSGGKSQSMKTMRQMQEQLNQQLKDLKNSMESMMKEGDTKGNKSGTQNISEQLARLAAEQEALRNEMKKYADQLNEQGIKDVNNLNDAMNKMEQTEKDLVNKRILQETLNRQQQILTRLLESEKAEQQREQEEKRQSTEAKNQKISNPSDDFQYKYNKEQASEILKKIPAPYNYFYKNKINSYLLKFTQ